AEVTLVSHVYLLARSTRSPVQLSLTALLNAAWCLCLQEGPFDPCRCHVNDCLCAESCVLIWGHVAHALTSDQHCTITSDAVIIPCDSSDPQIRLRSIYCCMGPSLIGTTADCKRQAFRRGYATAGILQDPILYPMGVWRQPERCSLLPSQRQQLRAQSGGA